MRTRTGFTLIELLVVVAIIAILAGIAIPNFMEAQMRAKVVRAQTDMCTIAFALEAYETDHDRHPPDPVELIHILYDDGFTFYDHFQLDKTEHLELAVLTTPVAFISSIPRDLFADMTRAPRPEMHMGGDWLRVWGRGSFKSRQFEYMAKRYIQGCGYGWDQLTCDPPHLVYHAHSGQRTSSASSWILVSNGPNELDDYGFLALWGLSALECTAKGNCAEGHAIYDATNGSRSPGDVVRLGT